MAPSAQGRSSRTVAQSALCLLLALTLVFYGTPADALADVLDAPVAATPVETPVQNDESPDLSLLEGEEGGLSSEGEPTEGGLEGDDPEPPIAPSDPGAEPPATEEEDPSSDPETITDPETTPDPTPEPADEPAAEDPVRAVAAEGATSADNPNARTTYEFYVRGEKVNTQIVTAADPVYEPAVPALGEHEEFLGWFIDADDPAAATKLDFQAGTLAATDVVEGATVRVHAAFQTLYYLTFHANPLSAGDEGNADGASAASNKILHVLKASGGVADISDVRAMAPSSLSVFLNWEDASGNPYSGTVNVDSDVDLYPHFADAYWVSYWAGETGSGASYTAPQFVLADEVLTELPVPTREGYQFTGWHLGSIEGELIAGSDGRVFAEGGFRPTDNVTLYATWEAQPSRFSIAIWKQKVTDSVDLNIEGNHAAKSYDYVDTVPVTLDASGKPVLTGAEVKAIDYLELSSDKSTLTVKGETGVSVDSMEGFELNEANSDLTATVAGNGTTVLNVRYDRKVYTFNFNGFAGRPTGSGQGAKGGFTYYIPVTAKNYVSNGDSVTVKGYDGNNLVEYTTNVATREFGDKLYATYVRYKGLYGAPLDFVWPTDIMCVNNNTQAESKLSTAWGIYLSSDAVPFTHVEKVQDGSTWNQIHTATATSYSRLETGHALPEGAQYDCFIASGRQSPWIYYKQKLDGTWPDEEAARFLWLGGDFMFDGKNAAYDGFRDVAWSMQEGVWSRELGKHKTPSNSAYGLRFRFERLTYSIDFVDPLDGQTLGTVGNIRFETPLDANVLAGDASARYTDIELAGRAPEDPAREGYTFLGWYADEAHEQLLLGPAADGAARVNELGNMPAHNIVLYAGWQKVKFPVSIDPAGGEISSTESTFFNVAYLETIKEYSDVTRNYVEDPDGEWYYHYDYYFGEGEKPGSSRAYYTKNIAEATDKVTRYREASEGEWTLVGWYRVGEGGVLEPYNFATPSREKVQLRAVWSRMGDFRLAYDAAEGKSAPSDDGAYADKSAAIVAGAPEQAPFGKVFIGWTVGGRLYLPGDVVTVDSHLAEGNTMTLTALYADLPALVSMALDANNDESAEAPEGLTDAPNNSRLVLPSLADTVSYYFQGWAQAAEAGAVDWLADQIVFANAGGATVASAGGSSIKATLYAIWGVRTPLTVTADSGRKVYDGTPLLPTQGDDGTGEDVGYTVSGSLAEGDELVGVTIEGSRTDTGSSPSVASGARVERVLDDDTRIDVSRLYNISYRNGALTVVSPYVPGGGTVEPDPEPEPTPDPEPEPELHTLTVSYVYANGAQAAPSHVEQVAEGATYRVTSPAIEGYTASQARVAGVMPAFDVTATVVYEPVAAPVEPDPEPTPDPEPPTPPVPPAPDPEPPVTPPTPPVDPTPDPVTPPTPPTPPVDPTPLVPTATPTPGSDPTPGAPVALSTPVTPTTLVPTAAPTPGGGTTVATPTPVEVPPIEVIPEDATPLAAPAAPASVTPVLEAIEDEDVPLAAFHDDPDCWVHWIMGMGMLLTALYTLGVLAHRGSNARRLRRQDRRILKGQTVSQPSWTPAGSLSY